MFSLPICQPSPWSPKINSLRLSPNQLTTVAQCHSSYKQQWNWGTSRYQSKHKEVTPPSHGPLGFLTPILTVADLELFRSHTHRNIVYVPMLFSPVVVQEHSESENVILLVCTQLIGYIQEEEMVPIAYKIKGNK